MSLSQHILDVSEATFEEQVVLRSHEVPVVVDFWAPWCGPCKFLSPILERQAIEGGGAFLLAKVNVDENPDLAIRYGVQGIPAVKAFVYGEVESEFVGAQPESMIKRFIESLAPSASEVAVEEARSLLGIRRYGQAESAFREAFEEDETNADAALGLVESLLMQGRGVEADGLLHNFPPGNAWARAQTYIPLAGLLSAVEVNEELDTEDSLEAGLYQAGRLIQRGNLEAAMDGLLDILRVDKRYKRGLPKDILLALFSLMGDEDPITRKYRGELASVLF